jgi:FMN phosphatase YigB (HAD superfamily)
MTVERRPPVTTLLLDLDDTLYDSSEMSEQVADNIRKYMVTRLGVGQADVEAL